MGNLPSEVNSFVGRRRELSELKLALGSSRLVTLVGPGGVGKTRLALGIATEVQRSCRDGVWLIELADVTDATLVAKAMMTALGLCDHSGRWPLRLLVDFLAGRDLLLVVDNCEHLLDACAIAIGEIMRRPGRSESSRPAVNHWLSLERRSIRFRVWQFLDPPMLWIWLSCQSSAPSRCFVSAPSQPPRASSSARRTSHQFWSCVVGSMVFH